MRQSLTRSGGLAGALVLASISAGDEPAAAQSAAFETAPVPRVKTAAKRPAGRVGRRMTVRGAVVAGDGRSRVSLQIARDGRWRTVARRRTRADGRYVLRPRFAGAFSARARIVAVAPDGRRASHRLGRLEVYRLAAASWYGPGLYGNRTGCGGTLTAASVGVAHKSLPCGTRVTLKHRGRRMRVPVIDRGPYVGGREYDLTSAVARRLGFSGHGPLLVTR